MRLISLKICTKLQCVSAPNLHTNECVKRTYMHSIININDSLTLKLLNVNDVKRHLPELLTAMKEWYRTCKIPDGNPENQFAFSREQKHVTVIQTVQLASHLVLC